MRIAKTARWLSMWALLLVAPVVLYVGFNLPILLSPWIGLSEGAQRVQQLSGILAVVLYLGAVVATGMRRIVLALEILAITLLIQIATFAILAVSDPVFRKLEREGQIRERFDAAAAAYPTQVWCNGGFAYLRQDGDEIEYDVLLHRPPSEGEFALWIGQFRVSDEHQSCDASVFGERYAEAQRWFERCPASRAAFESLVDRIRKPSSCPHPTIHHWP